jgi:hypothetical protein
MKSFVDKSQHAFVLVVLIVNTLRVAFDVDQVLSREARWRAQRAVLSKAPQRRHLHDCTGQPHRHF